MGQIEYTLEWILSYVRRIQPGTSLNYRLFADHVWQQLERAGIDGVVRTPQQHMGSGRIFYYDAFPPELKNATAEAWFYLFRNGYLAPAAPNDYLHAPNLYDNLNVTKRGIDWFASSEPIPEDAQAYMAFIHGLVGSLDSVIEDYVKEALIAFNRGAFLAAAVMIGASAEKEAYLLAEAILVALKDATKRKKMQQIISESRSILLLEKSISDVLPPLRKTHRAVFDGSDAHLTSLFEAIRVQRNEAVHPKSATVSSENVRMTILAFPHALAKSEEMRAWFIGNPNSL
ncbi:MAG: hypothetical protein JST28_13815 [Acidobacteria bacterium]|nr:hypothetical protein [Acidobacteriota bacterium]